MASEVHNSRLFSSHGLCPRVFAVFGNGFAHESAVAANNGSGVALNADLAVDRSIYPIVARRDDRVAMCLIYTTTVADIHLSSQDTVKTG